MKKEDIDNIIEENEECDFFKPSHLFLTISILCLIIVFGLFKGLCIFGFVVGCIWFFNGEDAKSNNKETKKKKEDTNQI